MSFRRHKLSVKRAEGKGRTYRFCVRCKAKVVGKFDKRGRCNPSA